MKYICGGFIGYILSFIIIDCCENTSGRQPTMKEIAILSSGIGMGVLTTHYLI